MDKDLKNKTLHELEMLCGTLGQQKFHAHYLFGFIHEKGARNLEQITTISKQFRQLFSEQGYYIGSINPGKRLVDKDGTIKYCFDLHDGNRVESVLLSDVKRKTLCISTQVGCPMGCVFCATAKIGFKRNLTASEIVDQVYRAKEDGQHITNVVYMGMGEPFNNYDEVLKSVRILNNAEGINLGIRHITISTCGIVDGISRLAKEEITPRLAISLNAPTDSIRTKLMPINKKNPLDQIIRAVENYQSLTQKRVTFEYVMIKGVNDSQLHAQLLIKLLRGIKCHVNLISFNPHAGSTMEPSDNRAMQAFRKKLEESRIEVTVREKLGIEIHGACGQLGASN